MTRILGLSALCLTFGTFTLAAPVPSYGQTSTAVPSRPGDPAFATFGEAVTRYLSLVQRLHREVPELRVTTQSAEINNRSDMLAGAIQRSRKGAVQGGFFDAQTARVIRERLATSLHGENVATLLEGINDEPVVKGPPKVHLRFPAASSMATMPSRLLEALPPLPQGLEFRFVGRALVLRDRDAAMILDYLPDALPTR
jgi:hypothetical protein